MWYAVALFVHVLGAIGLFIAVSLVVVAFVRMRRAATLDQVRDWASVAQLAGKSIALIGLVILAPALYMVVVAWGFTVPWVLAALVTFVVLAVVGATVNGRTIERVAAAAQATESGPIPGGLRAQLTAPQLWLAEGARLGLLVGIVFLMTVKPDTLGSLLVLASMLVLGLILGVLAQRSRRSVSRKEQRVGASPLPRRETAMSQSDTLDTIQALLARSGSSHTVLLTSFRRNGQGVSSPVGMMSASGRLYFMTPASSWKARRIANNPQVTLALCAFRGQVLGPTVEGMARRLAGSDAKRARSLLCAGFYGRLMDIVFALRFPGDKTAVYEVLLPAEERQAQHGTDAFGSPAGEAHRVGR